MDYLIIPDIHLEHERAERIIAMHPGMRVIFLGDYFDAFDDSEGGHTATARWLTWSVQQPNRTHLLGNHDPYYFTGKKCCECPGNNDVKYKASRALLTQEVWTSMYTHFWLRNNFLATHAGLSINQAHPMMPLPAFMERQETQFKEACRHNLDHPWLHLGSRGMIGARQIAGPLWCDWNDFEGIPGLHQIFGHSVRKGPKVKSFGENDSLSWNINLDGAIEFKDGENVLNYPGGYAVLKAQELIVYNTQGKSTRKLNIC